MSTQSSKLFASGRCRTVPDALSDLSRTPALFPDASFPPPVTPPSFRNLCNPGMLLKESWIWGERPLGRSCDRPSGSMLNDLRRIVAPGDALEGPNIPDSDFLADEGGEGDADTGRIDV